MSAETPDDRTEKRRRAMALLWSLPKTATWEDIDAASEGNRRKIDEIDTATSEERRQNLARAYNLPPDATWDQIYARWKKNWGYNAMVMRSIATAAILPIVILVISTHWIAIALSVLIFVIVSIFVLFGSILALEDEYWGNVMSHPEILNRAKKDGIYD